MLFPIAALFVAQSVFNGVVLACFVGDTSRADAAQPADVRGRALRQVSAVLVGALFAMSGVLPLAFAWGTGEKISETAETLAIGGLLAAAVLAIVVAPLLYALTVRWGKGRRADP